MLALSPTYEPQGERDKGHECRKETAYRAQRPGIIRQGHDDEQINCELARGRGVLPLGNNHNYTGRHTGSFSLVLRSSLIFYKYSNFKILCIQKDYESACAVNTSSSL